MRQLSFTETVLIIGFILLVVLLVGCAGQQERPEPEVRTVEVKVEVPIRCKALDDLGAEPEYPDTDAALKAAPNIFERTKLLVRGRLLRVGRLGQYQAARASC